ncbi:complement factor H isoform X1 [Astyanax mexicanus]|uniref:complement factor H isoform X1 n=2 Tax=Astyanax mexicanus TaxID=7994 RepID=UPI0020CB1BD4|nr:complement factor H isoform X1 [Astyanax mexicanus]
MQSSLLIVYLFFSVSVYTSVIRGKDGVDGGLSSDTTTCPEILPKIDNGDVSPASLKSNYTEGDRLLYTCRHGYTSLGKIIYVCNKNQWVNIRDAKCSLKRCELPADIPNAHFVLMNGTDFVFGNTIKYICNEGYKMGTRIDTRTCLAGGWSNHLPQCEEVSCLPPATEGNVIVDGFSDYSSRFRYGHRVQFACDSPALKLVGLKEVTCQANGEWNGPLPTCEGATCKLEKISAGVSVFGVPERNAPMNYGHKLEFYCSNAEMVLRGRSEVTCSTGGSWSSPFPTCEEITCMEEELYNVKIVRGIPGKVPPYKPTHTLQFQCTHSSMTMLGLPSIKCRSDGTWSSPYPTCSVLGACGPPPSIDFATLNSAPQENYKHGQQVQYTCSYFHTQEGNPRAVCHQGTWYTNLKCLQPCLVKTEDMHKNKIYSTYQKKTIYVYHGYHGSFVCDYGKWPKNDNTNFRPLCSNGVISLPRCI